MRHLEARDPADLFDQPPGRLVGLEVARRVVLREVHDDQRELEPTGVHRLLEGQLHAVGLALDAVEQNARHRLVPARYPPLLDGVNRPGERRREHLVA